MKSRIIAFDRDGEAFESVTTTVDMHSHIRQRLMSCSFGFAQSTCKGDHRFLAFALGRIHPEDEEEVDIDLVFSSARRSSTTEALLLSLIEEKARTLGVRRARILTLPLRRLQTFYEDLGYKRKVIRLYWTDEKFYEMIKFL
jgi:hypothetical protein